MISDSNVWGTRLFLHGTGSLRCRTTAQSLVNDSVFASAPLFFANLKLADQKVTMTFLYFRRDYYLLLVLFGDAQSVLLSFFSNSD